MGEQQHDHQHHANDLRVLRAVARTSSQQLIENIKLVNSKFSPALKKACAAKHHRDILKHAIKQFGPLKVMAHSYDKERGNKGKLYGLWITLNKNVRALFMAWIWSYFDVKLNRPIMQVVNAHQLPDIELYGVEPSLKYMMKCLRSSMHNEEGNGV